MLHKNIRGQNLSITVLIVAALAITVFIVVSFIFFRGTGQATTALSSCEQQGHQCITGTSCGQEAPLPRECPATASGAAQICCTKTFGPNATR